MKIRITGNQEDFYDGQDTSLSMPEQLDRDYDNYLALERQALQAAYPEAEIQQFRGVRKIDVLTEDWVDMEAFEVEIGQLVDRVFARGEWVS